MVDQSLVAATKDEKGLGTVRDLLDKMKGQLQMALPRHMKADRMVRIALTSVQKNPKLLECAPITLVGAVVQAAQLGLEPDDGTGKAYLIPFWNGRKSRMEVQFMPGYKGLIELARRSGEIQSVEARTVHERDHFIYEFGLEPKLVHRPSTETERGKATHYYAVARFTKGGTPSFDVMPLTEINFVFESVKAKNKGKGGVWETHFDEMAKKTVVRRLCKYLPSSPELQLAINLDERADNALPQDLGALVDPVNEKVSEDASAGTEPKRAGAALPEGAAQSMPVISVEQRTELRNLLLKHKVDLLRLNAHMDKTYGFEGTEKIPAPPHSTIYQDVCAWIKAGGQEEIPFGTAPKF